MDYKAAYEREKAAREKAENILEDRSRSLFQTNQSLENAYKKLKNQKSQLIHQEKLASIGQLAAGVAHEINNPIGFVRSNLTTLERYLQQVQVVVTVYQQALCDIFDNENPAFSAQLNAITEIEEKVDIDHLLQDMPNIISESLEGTDRVTEIVKGLKSFARTDSDTMEPLDVNACLDNTLKLVHNEIKYKAEVIMQAEQIPTTFGYPGNFSQVIMNLLVNASQAIREFGTITIKTYADEQYIMIDVSDTGAGMDTDTINRIFDPFYTTKPAGQGTGLGLAISLGIIKRHRGHIQVDSEINVGTTFKIQLPILTEQDTKS
jgi:two-component system NtrC family sensor kinase